MNDNEEKQMKGGVMKTNSVIFLKYSIIAAMSTVAHAGLNTFASKPQYTSSDAASHTEHSADNEI